GGERPLPPSVRAPAGRPAQAQGHRGRGPDRLGARPKSLLGASAPMTLLCLSSGNLGGAYEHLFGNGVSALQQLEEVPGQVALEAAADLAIGLALPAATLDVLAGGLVVAHPVQGDGV